MTGRRPQDDVFDARVFDALRLAEADPEEAAKVLLLAAEYLRSGQRMPSQLAVFVADAFEAAMSQPQNLRAKALTDWLYLSAKNKRRARFIGLTPTKLFAECQRRLITRKRKHWLRIQTA